MDRNGPTKIPKRTSVGTETDLNRLQWVPKRTGTDFSSLQLEPEKVGWGTLGTILIKVCMYVGRLYVCQNQNQNCYWWHVRMTIIHQDQDQGD